MQATKQNYSTVFQIEGTTEHYHVPKFQREYTWGRNNWEVLLDDINENDPGYFVGSIIVVNDRPDLRPNEEKVYQVIDGQQRLTTLALLLAAIYKRYKEIRDELEQDDEDMDDFTIKLNSIHGKLIKSKKIFYDNENGGFIDGKQMLFLRVQPSTQSHNLDDFKYVLSRIKLLKNASPPKHYGNRLIAKAFRYFYDNIPENKEGLDELLNKINSLIFIHISVSSQADAFTLFETLNNRGVALSPIDIIKNSLLAALERQNNQDIDTSYDQWQELLSHIPDFDNQIRFLRQNYNAFKVYPEIKQVNVTKATRSNIIHIYEKQIKSNAWNTFNNLLSKAELYGKLIGTTQEEDHIVAEKMNELNYVGAASSYTLLLYLLDNRSKLKNPETLAETIEFLLKYYVRRNVTDIPNTRDLDAINMEVVEKCDEEKNETGFITTDTIISSHLLNSKARPASIEDFKRYLNDDLFANNVGMTRYLLWKLDAISHNREYKPDFWKRNPNNDTYIWTIEHVLPQGKNIPDEWVNMIAEGNREEAENIQIKWVHKLGNLTLSAYNPNLSNKSFNEKQTKAQKNVLNEELYIGYKNGLALNKISFRYNGGMHDLTSIEEWNEKTIEARTDVMVKKLISIFQTAD
jgi:uncharacterized protein with ParB-like and HNH nuclease domain